MPAPGSTVMQAAARTVDFTAKVLAINSARSVLSARRQLSVIDADVVDDSMVDGKVTKANVSLW